MRSLASRTCHACYSWLPVLFICGCDASDQNPTWSVDTVATGRIEVQILPNTTRPEWQLERVIRIGAEDGAEATTFGRVCDVALGADATIYVLDCQSSEVRLFNIRGRHIRSVGREGAGPGEFRGPFAMAFDPEGRLWIADESGRRYTVLSRDGDFVATLRRPIRWPATAGALLFSHDGTLHEYGWWSNGPGAVIRITVDSIPQVRDSIPLPPWSIDYLAHRDRPSFTVAVPLTPRSVVGIGPNGEVWTGLGHSYQFALVTPTGDSARVIEVAAQPEPLTVAELRQGEEAVAELQQQGFTVEASRLPSTRSYFTSMVVSALGEVWVGRAEVSLDGRETRRLVYDVFSSDGRLLSTAVVPVVDDPPPRISGDFLIGVSRDALDRDYVEVYRIRRGTN